MGRLDSKVAIISGGVQGIGRACAVRMAEEGAQVVVADLQDDTDTVDRIRSNGGEAHQIVMDTRKREDWQRTVAGDRAAVRHARRFSATSRASST